MPTALISVYHKEGIDTFAKELIRLGWTIISSGGTARFLHQSDIPVTDIAQITGLSPVLDHRVVTLVPHIHGGLLATDEMQAELEQLGYPQIDLCCVDFYPLEAAISDRRATTASVIEKTDIGGPTMIRSAAKGRRIVIVDPADRMKVIPWLDLGKPDEDNFRRLLAAKAEALVAQYCLRSAIFHSGGLVSGSIDIRIKIPDLQ